MKMYRCVMVCAMMIWIILPVNAANSQPHLADSMLINLDLQLDGSALPSANLQVRIHATDRINDTYYASPPDPDEGSSVTWQQQLPLMTDSNVPMRLILSVAATDGSPLPAGYAVQWQFTLDGQASSGSSVTIPAGSTEDMNLTVRGTVIGQ